MALRRAGFSLLFASVLLAVLSILLASLVPVRQAGDANYKTLTNVRKLEEIEEAMRSFMARYSRRPCPAGGQYAPGNANFGIEAGNPGDCAAANFSDGGNIRAGVIPTVALGLPDDVGLDDFGRRFTYVIDKRATAAAACLTLMGSPLGNGPGGNIVIKNGNAGNVIDNTMYAYISHGSDGHGAFPAQGSTVANRINTGSADADQNLNAGVDGSFATTFTNVKIQHAWTPTFDDLVWYRPATKNTCCLGSSCIVDPMIAYWPFEEGAGPTTADATGNGHDATRGPNAAFSNAPAPPVLGFANNWDMGLNITTRINGYVSAPDTPPLRSTNVKTVAFWMQMLPPPPPNNMYQTIIAEGDGGANAWGVGIRGDSAFPNPNTLEAAILVGGVTASASATATALLADTWYHVAVEFTPAPPAINAIYINGVAQALTAGSNMEPLATNALFIMGARPDLLPPTTVYAGYLDDVRLYARQLSAADIAGIMR